MVRWLGDLGSADVAAFGAKAVNLGEMMRLGFEVPSGFALPVAAYRRLAEALPYSKASFEDVTDEIAAWLRATALPDAVAKGLDAALTELAGVHGTPPRFAVRSSAVCEDGTRSSMAGVFDSFVNVETKNVPRAVKECYCSLYSDRAVDAYVENGVEDQAMGVIVQRFLPGGPSGVLFTADPVTGNREVMKLTVVSGWCSDAVSGSGPKALLSIDSRDGSILDSRVPPRGVAPTPRLVAALFRAGTRLQDHFDCPVDIEWTEYRGALVLLQVRPVTGIPTRGFTVRWENSDLSQYRWEWPAGPMRPLVADMLVRETLAANRGAVESGLDFFNTAVCEQDGYVYFRQIATPDRECRRGAHLDRVRALEGEGKNIFTDEYLPRILTLRESMAPAFALTPESDPSDLLYWFDAALAHLDDVMGLHWLVVDGALSEEALQDIKREFGLSTTDAYDLVFLPTKLTQKRWMAIDMAAHVGDEPHLRRLFADHPSDRVVYRRLGRTQGGRDLLSRMAEFQSVFGHTRIAEFLEYRTYAEFPEAIIGDIRAALDEDSQVLRANLQDVEERKRAIRARLMGAATPGDTERLDARLAYLERSFTVRDDHSYYIDLAASGPLRHVILRIADMLASTGALSRSSDIEFLRLAEIRETVLDAARGGAPAERIPVVEKRRRVYEEQRRIAAPDVIGANDASVPDRDVGRAVDAGEADAQRKAPSGGKAGPNQTEGTATGEVARGYSGLARRVRGTVVTARNLAAAPREGRILVLSDVREMEVSRFASAIVGIIVENGSPLDHIGIWARERGIPTIFSAAGACAALADGDVVELDGIAEVVRRV